MAKKIFGNFLRPFVRAPIAVRINFLTWLSKIYLIYWFSGFIF